MVPSGAKGGFDNVCLFVCPSDTNLSKALNLNLSSFLGLSQVSQLALLSYTQTEPKILRLVNV